MSWSTIVEYSRYTPVRLAVTDTAPWVPAGTYSGVECPAGWATRARELGGSGYWDWHTRGAAADFAGHPQAMAAVAAWWMQFSDCLLELIHVGFLVKDGQIRTYTTAWGHSDHVHVAANPEGLARMATKPAFIAAKADWERRAYGARLYGEGAYQA